MPDCRRICHCVAPGPFLAAALDFLPLNLVGSALAAWLFVRVCVCDWFGLCIGCFSVWWWW